MTSHKTRFLFRGEKEEFRDDHESLDLARYGTDWT